MSPCLPLTAGTVPALLSHWLSLYFSALSPNSASLSHEVASWKKCNWNVEDQRTEHWQWLVKCNGYAIPFLAVLVTLYDFLAVFSFHPRQKKFSSLPLFFFFFFFFFFFSCHRKDAF